MGRNVERNSSEVGPRRTRHRTPAATQAPPKHSGAGGARAGRRRTGTPEVSYVPGAIPKKLAHGKTTRVSHTKHRPQFLTPPCKGELPG